MKTKGLIAPFPYFGGKSLVADIVWAALGDVRIYCEPFFGSGAVLFRRPNYIPEWHIETVCDIDCLIANAWRAMQQDPDRVAKYCDWPINHADLIARRKAIKRREPDFAERIKEDEKFCDFEMAGYWVWGASTWIGCTAGLSRINAKPQLGYGVGINSTSRRSSLWGPDDTVQDPYNFNIYVWFRELSERLRYVRVVCGNWKQALDIYHANGVIGQSAGIFLDPPYSAKDRDPACYRKDSLTVADDVREWSLLNGSNSKLKIVIAGYEEHLSLLEHGWSCYNYKSQGGLSVALNNKSVNRFREHLYFSPNCDIDADILQKEGIIMPKGGSASGGIRANKKRVSSKEKNQKATTVGTGARGRQAEKNPRSAKGSTGRGASANQRIINR